MAPPPPAGPDETAAHGTARPAWWIYQGTGQPLHDVTLDELLPDPPPWRDFRAEPVQPPPPDEDAELDRRLGPLDNQRPYRASTREITAVNSALYLRRPLLVTGDPGIGKSSLAYRITRELRLGRVLRWPIGSHSTLTRGLYGYDPIARVQDIAARQAAAGVLPGAASAGTDREPDTAAADIGEYIQLGPLGTALLPYELPRVLLVDELDKGSLDLLNDLLDVFEEGQYTIEPLVRLRARQPRVEVNTDDPDGRAVIERGAVRCRAFPVVIITSNAEREFPPPFLRRCLRLELEPPSERQLANMVAAHFADRVPLDGEGGDPLRSDIRHLIRTFLEYREQRGQLAADQLLNSIHLASSGADAASASWNEVLDLLWQRLTVQEPEHE